MTISKSNRVSTAPVYTLWQVGDRKRQSTGRISSIWNDQINRDGNLKQVVMVIDLRIGGERGGFEQRISCQPVTVITDEGSGLYSYSPQSILVEEPEITNEYSLGEATSSARSMSLTINPKEVDPASLIQKGLFLAGFAEVSLVYENCLWEDRYVIIRGDIGGGVSFGGRRNDGHFSTMDFEIVDPRETSSSRMPPWVITNNRISIVQPQLAGERYSVALNEFRYAPTLRRTTSSSGGNKFIICQGTLNEVTATTVYVNGQRYLSSDANYPWLIEEQLDNFGVSYIEVNFTSPVTTVWEDGDTVYVHIEVTRKNSIVMSIYKLLSDYSSFGINGLNPELFSTADSKILLPSSYPQVLVNASGENNAADAISFVESGYLSSYPMVSMIWENGGYGPIVTDFRLDPISNFIAGQFPIYDRASLVQESPKSEIQNEFILRYNYNAMLDIYESVETRNSDNSSLCTYSQSIFGYRAADTIESVSITDQAAAVYVLDWCVAHYSLPSYYVEYDASPSVFLTFRRGDTVRITDDEFGWDAQSATIEKITYRAGKSLLGLRVWVRFVDYGGSAYSVGGAGTQITIPAG